MRTFKRFCWFTLLIGILIVALTSCGSKKKVVEKEEHQTEIKVIEKTEEKTERSTEEKKEAEAKKETESEDFTAEVEDPNKDFEIKKETKDGVTKWTGKNIKKFTNNTDKTKDSSGQKMSKVDKSENNKKSETEAKEKTNSSKEAIDVEKTGFNIPFYWWIVLALIVIGYLAFSYFRKSLNPLKWL